MCERVRVSVACRTRVCGGGGLSGFHGGLQKSRHSYYIVPCGTVHLLP